MVGMALRVTETAESKCSGSERESHAYLWVQRRDGNEDILSFKHIWHRNEVRISFFFGLLLF